MASKVCGYVAPSLGTVVVAWFIMECCKKESCWGGKCIPSLLIMGSMVCQALTFLLFQSELFCGNEDIEKCSMGDAGYRSLQACLVYAFSWILFYCGPSPKSLKGVMSSSGSSSRKKKEVKSKPGKDEDYTREMYEQRRKEKKIKSRGVSGRSKKEIFNDLKGDEGGSGSGSRSSSRRRREEEEYQLALYDPEQGNRDRRRNERRSESSRGSSSQPRYDDYVDEPDGMDWSAYSPGEREAYYERKRAQKRQQREREREERGRDRDYHEDEERRYHEEEERRYYDDRAAQDQYGYDDGGCDQSYASYDDRGYDDDSRRHGDSYRSGDDYTEGYDSRAVDEYYPDEGDYDRRSSRGESSRGRSSRSHHESYSNYDDQDSYDDRGRGRAGKYDYDDYEGSGRSFS